MARRARRPVHTLCLSGPRPESSKVLAKELLRTLPCPIGDRTLYRKWRAARRKAPSQSAVSCLTEVADSENLGMNSRCVNSQSPQCVDLRAHERHGSAHEVLRIAKQHRFANRCEIKASDEIVVAALYVVRPDFLVKRQLRSIRDDRLRRRRAILERHALVGCDTHGGS